MMLPKLVFVLATGMMGTQGRLLDRATIEPMCPSGHHIEQHTEETHGNVCRADNSLAFICPRCCRTLKEPPYCASTNATDEVRNALPCRAETLTSCGSTPSHAHGTIHKEDRPVPAVPVYTIHTFFEVLPSWTAEEQQANQNLLGGWERMWSAAGWKTKIIGLADAKTHPDFKKLDRILDAVPLGTNQFYDRVCFSRHLAMAAVGGGWMSDYDTIPLHIQSGMPLPNEGRWTSFEWSVPSLISGTESEWRRMANMLVETGSKHQDVNLFSDMMAMQELAGLKPPPYTLELRVLGLDQIHGNSLWGPSMCTASEQKLAAHMSHYAFVTGGRNQADRAGTIADTSAAWQKECVEGARSKDRADNAVNVPLVGKVFFVGLHKTGTSTLYNIFKQQPHITVQHRADWWYYRDPRLFANTQVWVDGYERYAPADTWMGKWSNQHPQTIAEFDVQAGVFPDIAWLNATFPGAHFIVQTRNFRDWVTSRIRHMCTDAIFNATMFNGLAEREHTVSRLVARWSCDRNRYYRLLDPHVASGAILKLDLYEPLASKLHKLSNHLNIALVATNVDANRDLKPPPDCQLLIDLRNLQTPLSDSNWLVHDLVPCT